jgi:hypothetical protein
MTFGIEALWHGTAATLVVLGILVVAQLLVAPRRMEVRARAEFEARERDLRDQIASLAPDVDAVLTATVLSVRPYVESRRIIGPGAAGLILGIEYRNESGSALEGCSVVWEGLELPTTHGWSKVDWFARHRLTWDDTGRHEVRIAAGQSRRVELVTGWPGADRQLHAASVRLPDEAGDGWLLSKGAYQVTLSLVADGYRERKEQYDFHWGDGQLSVDQSSSAAISSQVHGSRPSWRTRS